MEKNILETVNTQEFTIKIAGQSDVVEAFYITKVVMAHLLKNNSIHPDLFSDVYERLRVHIEKESLYIIKKGNISLGMLTFEEKEPEEFKDVSWEHKEALSFYISRIFVLPYWRNKWIGSTLLQFAEELARVKGYNSVRLDTSSTFEESNLLLMKHNYRFAGNIFYNFQKAPVNCYEKRIL